MDVGVTTIIAAIIGAVASVTVAWTTSRNRIYPVLALELCEYVVSAGWVLFGLIMLNTGEYPMAGAISLVSGLAPIIAEIAATKRLA